MKYFIKQTYRGMPTLKYPNGRLEYSFMADFGFYSSIDEKEILKFSQKTAKAICEALSEVNSDDQVSFSYHPVSR